MKREDRAKYPAYAFPGIKSACRFLICAILFLAGCLPAQAQQAYPVQVYTQLVPPYTPHIPAYYTGTQAKLKVMLINTDMQQPAVNVYLRMKILSSSFSAVTPPEAYTPQIELQAGMPVTLSLNDLEPYFKKENLRVSGGQSEFYRTQMLPDNFYRFHFEVYEAGTNRLVSNTKTGFAQAMIASGEPPVLNLPQKGAVIKESNIPSILFSWTPRHMNSIAAAYGTEYDISLVEIYDKQVAPEAAFDYSRVLYTETTKSTSFIHTAAQPLLIPGMRYAWRVQAKAREGVDEISVFKNNGYSPISWFDYTADCKTVQSCGAIYENGHVDISWQDVGAMEYTVEYRKKGTGRWYTGTINKPLLSQLYNLQAGKDYEYRIGSRCVAGDTFLYNDPQAFHIPARQENGPDCGLMPDISLTNRIPARELQSGMPVLVGDFPVFITKVSGSGRFTGEGYVGIPYLQGTQIAVTFKDIVVNTDNRLVEGFFETKYDTKNNNLLLDADEYQTGGKGVGDIRSGEEQAAFKVDYTINPDIKALPLKADGTKDEITEGIGYTISKGENGKYTFVLTDSEGKEHKVEADTMPATIEDKEGNTYEVNEKGEVKPLSKTSDITLDTSTKDTQSKLATLSFRATKNTKYALDEYRDVYEKVTEYNDQYKPEGTAITASAKFMLPGVSDEISVYIKENKENKLIPEKVRFITGKGKEYSAVYDNQTKEWTLTIVGGQANDGQELYAVQDTGGGKYETLGKLNIFTYEPLERKVTLVPVNGVMNGLDRQAVQDGLNRIYGKIGVTWTVNVGEPFNFTPKNGKTFNVTGSGLLSMFTDDMKAINTAFEVSGEYREDGLYLFVLPYLPSDRGEVSGTNGDMPLDSQFGYLFAGADDRTIAHEVGHGAFNLEHPFDRPGRNSFEKGALKDNLMDYAGGEGFAKIQWDATRAPGHVIGLFQKDKSGMDIQTNAIPHEFADNAYFNFLTPTGRKITLPEKCAVRFKYGITTSSADLRSAIGYLASFKIIQDGKETEYTCSIVNNSFTGYYNIQTNVAYIDEYTGENTQSNAVTVSLTTTGLRFIKVDISDLRPYTQNEPVTEYDLFPVLPYKTGNIAKTSGEINYSDIKNIIASSGEDWSLNREFLSSMLDGHEDKLEYGYVAKIIELRTAYRGLFDSFTLYFDKWNGIQTEETIYDRQTGHYDVKQYSLSQWDKLYTTDASLQNLWKNDPVEYYKRFADEFITFIQQSAGNKQDFLSKLTLSTKQSEVSDYLTLCSNDEIGKIPWDKREILLRILASESISGNDLEKNIVRLVKYIPQADISSLLNALKTQKDAKGKDNLLYCFMGKTINDLNGQEFYGFVGIIHSYLNEKYQYDRSPSAIGLNKRESRYFSFDPSFWANKPLVIEMNPDGSIRLAFRKQFTAIQYDPVTLPDPYASVTLYFEDDKTSGEFSFKKDHVYTTSGLMAYALCYSILKDNAKIGGFAVLNTALMATGIGELNAALQAGRTGAAVLAGTDIALGVGYIVVDTGYRDKWQQSEEGKTILEFWDGVNLLYAGGRITQALYNSAQAAKTSANTLKNSADDAERAILEETEQQVDDVITRFNVENFVGRNINQQYAEIANVWKSKYPIEEMFEGRTFFERLMGEYRYTKAAGWGHTGDIAHNFKGVDFYKGATQGEKIYAETAVSMKTTVTKDVNVWLKSEPIQKNIEFLTNGLDQTKGIVSNNKTMFITNAEIHIYMPKENMTDALKIEWLNKLNTVNPKIKFEIKSLEDYIK